MPDAGWYPDPAGSGRFQWWNGSAWTGQFSSPQFQAAPAQPPVAPRRRISDRTPVYNPYIWTIVALPLVSLICGAAFVVAILVSHKASVASLTMAVLLPVVALLTGRPAWEVVTCVGVSALVIARHSGNIRRLVGGDELSLS